MNKKRIGLKVSQNLGVNAHGAETHTVVEFMKYFSDEFHIDIIGAEKYPDELSGYKSFNYINYLFLPKIFRKLLHIPCSILNTIIYVYRNKPDLLFIPGGVFYNGLAIVVAGKIFGVTTLVRTAEDHFNYYKFCENWSSKLKHYLVTNYISKFVLLNSDYVLTVGERSKEYFISKGVRRESIFGIPGPTSQVDFSLTETKEELRDELGLPKDKTIVLYVGAISGVKGTDELPSIIEDVLSHSNNFHFCVIGSETNGTKITKNILAKGKNSVSVLSPKPHNELRKYFNAADVLVFLTKVGVGYGQVTIEATKASLPVVAYDPGLDGGWFFSKNAHKNISDISKSILSSKYSTLDIGDLFDESTLRKKHLKMLHDIFLDE